MPASQDDHALLHILKNRVLGTENSDFGVITGSMNRPM
jgi:hypothetical protein